MHLSNKYLGYEGDITFYLPEWIGKIICKCKGFHQWEFFPYCHKCGVEMCERLSLDCSPNCQLFHLDVWPAEWNVDIEK